MKAKRIAIAAIVIAAALASGCSWLKAGKLGPKEVAGKFWGAMKSGNIEKAKAYITKASFDSIKDSGSESKKGGEYTLGDAKIEGDKASIPTTIKDKGFSFELETVCVKEDGKWKVDADKTMMSMLGGAMGEMMKGMGNAVGSAMEEGAKGLGGAMGKAIGEGVKEFDKALQPDNLAKAPAATGKTFSVDDKVLVEWRGRWWPAKVIEAGDNKWKITYDGYDSSWDEWVGPDRINQK